MKTSLFAIFITLSGFLFAQEDTTSFVSDTTDIYVINATNRLASVGNAYILEFRDLRSIKETRCINFSNTTELKRFFEDSYMALDRSTNVDRDLYTLRRNLVSKNMLTVELEDKSYFLLTYGTIEKMEKAFYRYYKNNITEE
jgi:hypothetical protein